MVEYSNPTILEVNITRRCVLIIVVFSPIIIKVSIAKDFTSKNYHIICSVKFES